MFCKKLCRQFLILYKSSNLSSNNLNNFKRSLHCTFVNFKDDSNNNKKVDKEVIVPDAFETIKNKNRNTYLEMVNIFVNRDTVYRRGHVEFIYAALKNMEEFGVHKDLEVYKALIDVLPKGKFIPTNIIQAEFMHYPKQQQCIIDLLEQMEENGVMPDFDMEDLLLNVFGKRGFPLRKYWRMMYWMPKFKNLSPWPVPSPVPDDVFELAKLAIERITSIDKQSKLTIYQTADIKDSLDDTWIVSGQSITQKKLLASHKVDEPIYVEGSFRVWIKDKPVNYFMLRGKPKPVNIKLNDADDVSNIKVPFFNLRPPISKNLKIIPSVHEQEDGVIFALCATGTSSKDSLLSWIRHLEKDGNPILANVPIVFTLRSGSKEVANVNETDKKDQLEEQ